MTKARTILTCIILATTAAAFSDTISESARKIPLLKDVDVVVVGGTMGGVKAATAARAAGADVFLVAPRPHLGEELVTSRLLWGDPQAEGADDPLVQAAFDMTPASDFTYSYDAQPNSAHPDDDLTVLTDGKYDDSAHDSVQFNADTVTISVTMAGGAQQITGITLVTFLRQSDGGFATTAVSITASADGQSYSDFPGTVTYEDTAREPADSIRTFRFAPSSTAPVKYLRLRCSKAYSRQLLGELMIGTVGASPRATSPFRVEKSLDAALDEAGVPFLTGSFATGVLTNHAGEVSGVVIANRNGRQAIRAKTVVDATEWAAVARRLSPSHFEADDPYASCAFTRVVTCMTNGLPELSRRYSVTERRPLQNRVSLSPSDLLVEGAPSSFGVTCYVISGIWTFPALDFAALAEIEQTFKDETWAPTTVDASEKLSFTPPDHIDCGDEFEGEWPGALSIALSRFQPKGVKHLYVLGPCADLPRAMAGLLQKPGAACVVGARIGAAAAADAATREDPGTVGCGTKVEDDLASIMERLSVPLNVGLDGSSSVMSYGAELPILAKVDVVVAGAGTAGAPAAIAAARRGCTVLALEYLHTMGGTAIDTRIGRYYHGNRRGFTTEIDAGWRQTGVALYTAKPEWYRTALRRAGGDCWFGAFVEGAVVTGMPRGGPRPRVNGVVVVLPDGTRGVVKATAVVDSTGNADVAAAAGAATDYLHAKDFALQGASVCAQALGNSYLNYDVGFMNDTDAGDLSAFGRRARKGMPESTYSSGAPITGTRERRRITGDVQVTEVDIIRGRTWPDTIMHGKSIFDSHGYTTSDLMMFYNHTSSMTFSADVPYRALLPSDLDGIIATGLGISATRDAMPVIRMQPDVQNQGYAAGLAAATAAAGGTSLRSIDVKALQQTLVDEGILEARVLTEDDQPVTEDDISSAISAMNTNFYGLEVVLADTAKALPLLQSAYAGTTDDTRKNVLACVLALLGDRTGIDDLVVRLNDREWDVGKNYSGMGQYGRSTTLMDMMVFALGKSSDARIVPVLAGLCSRLSAGTNHQLSHYRMMALASDGIFAPQFAAEAKALFESHEEMFYGKATSEIEPVTYNATADDAERSDAILAINMAKLLYRQNDADGCGEALLNLFAADARGAYAEYARLVLAEGPMEPEAINDGTWIGTSASDSWSNTSGWENGTIASGSTAKATISADSPTTTLSLGGETVTVGELDVQGEIARRIVNGELLFAETSSPLTVAGGGSLAVEADLSAHSLEKKGDGTLTIKDRLHVDDSLTVTAGTVSFDSSAPVYQPYTVGEDVTLDTREDKRGYGYSFTVASGPMWVTHLGCYESNGDGFSVPLRTYLTDDDTAQVIAEASFDGHLTGFRRGGYVFARLPTPCKVEAGKTYTIRSYGFVGGQTCPIAADGADIAQTDSADGRLTFGTVLKTGGGLNLFEDVVAGKTGYAAAAASLLLTPVAPEQAVGGTLKVDASVTVGSPMLSVGNLSGTGSVAAGRTDSPVLLKVTGADDCTFHGSLVNGEGNGKFTLEKTGQGTLRLEGDVTIGEMAYCHNGVLDLASADMLDEAATVAFGDPKARSTGVLSIDGPQISLANPIYASKQYKNNVFGSGIRAKAGQSLTLHDTRIFAYNSIENSSGFPNSFSLMTTPSADTASTITVTDVGCEYLDLFAVVPGGADFASSDMIWFENLESLTQMRKLVILNNVAKSKGGTVVLTGTNTVSIGWLDVSGYGSTLVLSNEVTVVADHLRYASINNGDYNIPEANGTLKVVDGARLVAPSIPDSLYNTTNSAIVFDNGIVQLKGGDQGNFFTLGAANPIYIMEGGVTFDLHSYDADAPRSLRIRRPLSSPADGVPGPLRIRNGGDLKFSAAMDYNGPTIVESGTLLFDFTVGDALALNTILKPGTDLVLAGGGVALQADHEGQYQSFRSIANTSGAEATVNVGANGEVRTAQLSAGRLVKTGAGAFSLTLASDVADSKLEGLVSVREGTFRIRSLTTVNGPYEMADGGFEPTPALTGGIGSLDKRGERDKAFLASALTGWTFDVDNNVGICKNGSYFMSGTGGTTWGEHCAFLRNGSGSISQTFAAGDSGMRYTLSFAFKSRYYGGVTYPAPIIVYLDEREIYASETKFLSTSWETVELDLGVLPSGDHTVRFTSGTDKAGSSQSIDVLLDNVCLSTIETSHINSRSAEHLTLDVVDGATLDLEFEMVLPIEAFYLNGERQYGIFTAATCPGLITGPGGFKCFKNGSVLFFR